MFRGLHGEPIEAVSLSPAKALELAESLARSARQFVERSHFESL